jgi:hypothetical protein
MDSELLWSWAALVSFFGAAYAHQWMSTTDSKHLATALLIVACVLAGIFVLSLVKLSGHAWVQN